VIGLRIGCEMEKRKSKKNFYEIGKKDGMEWTNTAEYKDVQYAARYRSLNEMMQKEEAIIYDPTKDNILGGYFTQIINNYKDSMEYVQNEHSHYVPNDAFCAWEQGWVDSVREFWEEIRYLFGSF
jgi:hypothetical protein